MNDSSDKEIEIIRSELEHVTPSKKRRITEKFLLAALDSIPWVGSVISATISLKSDEGDMQAKNLQRRWLDEHTKKIEDLKRTLEDITNRFEKLGDRIDERIQNESYLTLVRRSFRTWDKSDTDEKRRYVANLVSNSAGTSLCSDDVIRLFIDWLDLYHEAHFAVIREIYQNSNITRYDIWIAIRGEIPREDSAEADLYKLLIRDLSMGGVIRQERDTNDSGEFLRRRGIHKRRSAQSTMESAFEDTKPYTLTDLGRQFVHYTMNDVVTRIGTNAENSSIS